MKVKRTDPFYVSAAWRAARLERLRMDYGMCVQCMEEFRRGERMRPRRATMVHHVLPISERPDLALEITNLISLCDQHHNREHPEKGGRGRGGREKPKPAMRIIKV